MENSHLNFRFCPWFTALFLLSGFSPKMNGYGALILESKCLRIPIPTVYWWCMFSMSWLNLRQTFRQQTCFNFGYSQAGNRIIFWLNCNPKPDMFRAWLDYLSSITNSATYFLFDDIFWGWYFWIQSQAETWFRLTKHESRPYVLLDDRPEKYKCNP